MLPEGLAYGRQGGPELPHAVMLVQVTLLAPQIVVPVLAASRRVGAHGLNVALRISADPHVLPGGRDHQGLDAGQQPRVLDDHGIRPEITEAASAAPAPDPGAAGVAAP